MTTEARQTIDLEGIDPLLVLGSADRNVRAIQDRLHVRIVLREGVLTVSGGSAAVDEAADLVTGLIAQARHGRAAELAVAEAGGEAPEAAATEPRAGRWGRVDETMQVGGNLVRPRTAGQARYLEAIARDDVVFGIGPAGTGKTFLGVAMAVAALNAHEVERILLVRPAVEAGESLGFLPGDYREKVDPYLRPLYDALGELMPQDRVRKLIEVGVIEIAPLAYMRGRTLNRAFVILDEGQNTTVGQMKMFLTRLGPQSKAVITGDITQVDLSDPQKSGLIQIQSVLAGVEQISFVYLDDQDVVRHRLVRDIIRAFEVYQEQFADEPPDDEETPEA